MKVQTLNLDTCRWQDRLEGSYLEKTMRVVLEDGTEFDVTDEGDGVLELRIIEGTLSLEMRSANVVGIHNGREVYG